MSQATLLFDVSRDHPGADPCGKPALIAVLPEHGNHKFRIPCRRYTHEPHVGIRIPSLGSLVQSFVAHHLGGARLAAKVDAFQVLAARSVERARLRHLGHAVGNSCPVLGIDGNIHIAGARQAINQVFAEVRGKLIRKHDVRSNQVAARCNPADDPGQLHRSRFHCALTDRNIQRLVGIPLAVVVLHQPPLARHQPCLLTGKINPGFLAVPKLCRVF